MAPETAMTPQQALEVLDGVEAYRERLTDRATGILWLLWGTLLAVSGFAMLAFEFYARPGLLVESVLSLVLLAVGVAGSLMVWRAHALEHDPAFRAWKLVALVLGFLAAVNLLQWLFGLAVEAVSPDAGSRLFGYYVVFAAFVAMLLTGLFRSRGVAAGGVASLLLLAGGVVAILARGPSAPSSVVAGNTLLLLSVPVVYALVGVRHYLRG